MVGIFINKLKRSHNCGELTLEDVGKQVVLMGWVVRHRDHGGFVFVDLRDRTGIIQIIFNPEHIIGVYEHAREIRSEFCLALKGIVLKRPQGQDNKKITTGQLEVIVKEFEILNSSKALPFILDEWVEVNENIRLRYRYLDIRRPKVFNNLFLRHRCIQAAREYLNNNGFLEIETPILTRSTPEGARDFLVPSRLERGFFYALPQSPQIFKQLLIVGGIDRYYQIARCFRDEDLRADRQPEFTQIDLEMSFVNEEDIILFTEGLIEIIVSIVGKKISLPIPRLTWQQSMDRFGLDTPDLRFGLELTEITDLVKDTGLEFFCQLIEKGFIIKAINGKGMANISRKDLAELISFAKKCGASGLTWVKIQEGMEWQSPIAKFFSSIHQKFINERLGAAQGDIFFFEADPPEVVLESLGQLRLELARRFSLTKDKPLSFCWITDFPLFKYNAENKRFIAIHHPFTAPKVEDISLLERDPLKICARSYDIVLNGNEIGGGSIRNHQRELQNTIFKILNICQDEINQKFGFLLEALSYGAPPHGGLALGFDRLIAILVGASSIREVIAFPKTQKGICLLTGAPESVAPDQLLNLGLEFHKIS